MRHYSTMNMNYFFHVFVILSFQTLAYVHGSYFGGFNISVSSPYPPQRKDEELKLAVDSGEHEHESSTNIDQFLITLVILGVLVLAFVVFLFFMIWKYCYQQKCSRSPDPEQIYVNPEEIHSWYPESRRQQMPSFYSDRELRSQVTDTRTLNSSHLPLAFHNQFGHNNLHPEVRELSELQRSHTNDLSTSSSYRWKNQDSSRGTQPSIISSGIMHDGYLEVDTQLFEIYPGTPQILFSPTNRSVIRVVENKIIVYNTQEVGSKGAILILDNMGISLTIAAGAIPENQKKIIILALSWDSSDFPGMEVSQALVSPVVYCGPHGLQLKTPALLRYKHCAFDPRDIQIMESQTELTSDKEWKVYCNAEEDEGKCKVSQDECQILIEHFTLFTSIQNPQNEGGRKWLQVAVFSSVLKPRLEHYQLRIYFLNKTPCALQWAIHNEAQFGGELVCPEKVFLLKGTKEDVQLQLLYMSRDWTMLNVTDHETVNYLHMWHGMCPHKAFCFNRNLSGQNVPKEISLNFSLFQESCENEMDKIVIQMAETNHNIFTPVEQIGHFIRILRPSSGKSHTSVRLEDYRGHNGNTQIPIDVRRQLILMLAPLQDIGTDWRDFAEELGFTCIPFLKTLPCPTSALLEYFETQFSNLEELYYIFKRIKRLDAARVIEEAIGDVPKGGDGGGDDSSDLE